MQYTPTVLAALIAAVVVGVLLFLRPASASRNPSTQWPVERHQQQRDNRVRRERNHSEGGATLWVGALEAAMALVMVLATLALTDAAAVPRPQSNGAEQVIVDATPEAADQQPSPSSATGGASPVRPTHRLVVLEPSADTVGGSIIIELDAPLPADRPVKFLINTNTSPQ